MNKSNFVIIFIECDGSEKSRFVLSLKEETSPVQGEMVQGPGDRPSTEYRPPSTEYHSGWLGVSSQSHFPLCPLYTPLRISAVGLGPPALKIRRGPSPWLPLLSSCNNFSLPVRPLAVFGP